MTIFQYAPLRFITAGSVDDGKSTLIGRLLYDSKVLLSDQITHISKNREGNIDFSMLTDGLLAEREQGITIDVAYRYFSTAKRKFIIADTPGHEQYTRNMVTGASTADAAIVLVDVSQLNFNTLPLTLLPQTKRHSAILHHLACPYIIVAVNKMDLIDFDMQKFEAVKAAYLQLIQHIGSTASIYFVPISALNGDNVVYTSQLTPWYQGGSLLQILEDLPSHKNIAVDKASFHFPVQLVQRLDGDKQNDFRGYQGRIEAGSVAVGDKIRVEPSGVSSVVSAIFSVNHQVNSASVGEQITLCLADDVDISRGNTLVSVDNLQQAQKQLTATLCWFDQHPLNLARKYLLKHTTQNILVKIKQIDYILDVKTLSKHQRANSLQLNDIGQVQINLQQPIFASRYQQNIATGSFILIDEASYHTVAAGMILA